MARSSTTWAGGKGVYRPFEPGNVVAQKHAAYSPRRVDPLASELVDGVLTQATVDGSPTAYLGDVSYRPALWSWARCEARIQLLVEWLSDRTDLDDEGGVRPAAELLVKLESQALKHRERLGLDPMARARLGRDLTSSSVDLARLLSSIDDDPDEAA